MAELTWTVTKITYVWEDSVSPSLSTCIIDIDVLSILCMHNSVCCIMMFIDQIPLNIVTLTRCMSMELLPKHVTSRMSKIPTQ